MTRLRSGTNKLRIETGRWKKPKEKESERVCRACLSGEVEDEKHFILSCTYYNDLREVMIHRIEINTDIRLINEPQEVMWNVLMNNPKNQLICEVLADFVSKAMQRREQI